MHICRAGEAFSLRLMAASQPAIFCPRTEPRAMGRWHFDMPVKAGDGHTSDAEMKRDLSRPRALEILSNLAFFSSLAWLGKTELTSLPKTRSLSYSTSCLHRWHIYFTSVHSISLGCTAYECSLYELVDNQLSLWRYTSLHSCICKHC